MRLWGPDVEDTVTVFTLLLIGGSVLGLVLGGLSNPLIYRLVFGGRPESADDPESWCN